jgi:hypothetical protein
VNRIPRVVHYCWFGGNPLGEREQVCIDSWKKFLPSYEIKRWDESNWNVRCCDYVSEAYDAKQWAFVSDYARLDILYRYGGLYFDTDVELLKSIDDIIERGPFMGFESDFSARDEGSVNPGLGFGTYPGLQLVKDIIDTYEGTHFVNMDGTYDQTTIVVRTTNALVDHGLRQMPGMQKVDGIWLYPSEYFNPKEFRTGEVHFTVNARSIHHFSMSWHSPLEKETHAIQNALLKRGIEGRRAELLAKILASVKQRDLSYFKRKVQKSRHDGGVH